MDKKPILFMDIDGKESPVYIYDHTVTNNVVGGLETTWRMY